MKIRNGFVSNSSSSSFIIQINKQGKKCPHCHRENLNFLDLIGDSSGDYSDDTKINARGAENVLKWMKNQLYYQDETWTSLIDKVSKMDTKGKELAAISISYHNQVANLELKNQIKSGSITKIWSDE